MHDNIPVELKALPQWVCAGEDKIPLNPRTGQAASVIDSATWGTFEEALRSGAANVGFVLTEYDPYTIIDLDNKEADPCTEEQWQRQQKILRTFDSYTERSTSGTGYHIVVKGSIPSGVNKDKVEIYTTGRYMICTGDVVRNSPINDYQEILDILYGEMSPAATVELEEHAGDLEDRDVVDTALGASNGDKFDELCKGDWQGMGYGSQSEADFALLSILAFYTRDNEQVRRLFRMSLLGKRDKAQKNDRYLDFALSKIRAKQPELVDFDSLTLPVPEKPVESDIQPPKGTIELPPGLVGEIASYIYQASIRPVPEISLAAAIAFVSGIAGRSYNVSGAGLNQYLILLAKTGSGKEGAVSGIDNLVAAVRPAVPMVDQFIGPGAFASGQALIKVLDDKPCFVSVLGEFGLTLKQLCDPRAQPAQVMLKKVLLDLYSKSGWTKVLRSSVYSDSEKNTKIVQAPNVTLLGEATPESFYDNLGASHIAEGLIPRFSVIEYMGPRPPRNRSAGHPPTPELVQRIVDLVTVSLTTSNNQTCCNIPLESEATHLLDAFDQEADLAINSPGSDLEMQLWNRAHLKALKLAGVIAVGVNAHNPVIDTVAAKWAIAFVKRDLSTMMERFRSGDIGEGDHRHESDIRRAVKQYLEMPAETRTKYKVPKKMLAEPVIPYTFLRRKLRMLTNFKDDRRGAVRAVEEAIKDMVKADILIQVPPLQAKDRYGISSDVYLVGPAY